MIRISIGAGAKVAMAAVLLAGCGSTEPRQAQRPGQTGAGGNSAAPSFDPERIEIHDHWMGLEGDVPVDAVYTFVRVTGGRGYNGFGTLARGGFGDPARRRASGPLLLTVPDAALHAFLRGLAQAPRKAGTYEPRIEHTDDYPELTIRLHTGGDLVELYSASQGDDRRPWRVIIGGHTYVSDSPAIADALKHLTPHLRRAELDRMIDRQSPQPQPAREANP